MRWNNKPLYSYSPSIQAPQWKEFEWYVLEDIMDEIQRTTNVGKNKIGRILKKFKDYKKIENGIVMYHKDVIPEVLKCLK